MKYIDYDDFIKSSRWQDIKDNYFASKTTYKKCWCCDKHRKLGFHLHHRSYHQLMSGCLSNLVLLCENCHSKMHLYLDSTKQDINKKLWKLTNKFIKISREVNKLPKMDVITGKLLEQPKKKKRVIIPVKSVNTYYDTVAENRVHVKPKLTIIKKDGTTIDKEMTNNVTSKATIVNSTLY